MVEKIFTNSNGDEIDASDIGNGYVEFNLSYIDDNGIILPVEDFVLTADSTYTLNLERNINYILTETRTVAGYQLNKPIRFTIDNENNIKNRKYNGYK